MDIILLCSASQFWSILSLIELQPVCFRPIVSSAEEEGDCVLFSIHHLEITAKKKRDSKSLNSFVREKTENIFKWCGGRKMLNTMKVQATITTTTTTVIAKMITKRKRNRRRLLLPMLIISLIVLSHGDRVDAATTGQLGKWTVASCITTTAHYFVTVKRSPILQRFLIEPDNLTVNIGESITLPCKVSNKAGTVQCKYN